MSDVQSFGDQDRQSTASVLQRLAGKGNVDKPNYVVDLVSDFIGRDHHVGVMRDGGANRESDVGIVEAPSQTVFVVRLTDGGSITLRDVPDASKDTFRKLSITIGGASGSAFALARLETSDGSVVHLSPSWSSRPQDADLTFERVATAGGRGGGNDAWRASPAGRWHALVMHEFQNGGAASLGEAMKRASKIWR